MRLIAAVILLCAETSIAQVSTTISLSNGVELQIGVNYGARAAGDDLKIEMAAASGNSFYRIFRDQSNLAVFAYEVMVSRTAGQDEFEITAKPAGAEFNTRFPNSDGGKPVPTIAAARAYPPIRPGQSAEIGLFEIPGSDHPIADVIQVSLNEQSKGQSAGRLRFDGLKIYLDRTLISTPGGSNSVAGRYTMFYIPGRGGYFFSTDAVPGRAFVIAGWIDRTRMQFTLDNATYDCVAAAPILVHSDRGEVWVYHDAAYKPEGNLAVDLRSGDSQASSDVFFAAASDSLNWWLR